MADIQGGWTGTAGYQEAFNKVGGNQDLLGQYGQTFASLFRDLVGRDPVSDESDLFFRQVVAPVGNFAGGNAPGQQELQDRTRSLISNNFQQQAQDQTSLELQKQQSQANDLSQLFRTQGQQTANTLEGQLQDFVQRTFEKIRPNLITSLQSQGLLNSGGLNQAIAGQQGDLARDAQDQLANYKLGVEEQANQIAFGGASAPYEYQRAQTMNRVPYLQQQGQDAITRAFQQRTNEQNYFNQLGLLERQNELANSNRPSFLKQVGGQLIGNLFSTMIPGASAMMGNKMYSAGGGAMPTPGAAGGANSYVRGS